MQDRQDCDQERDQDRDETVTDLRCDQVRWFYAACRKSKSKSHFDWEPFASADSLLIELHYRHAHQLPVDTQCPAVMGKVG